MKIDLAKSGSYTRRQDRALRQGNLAARGGAEPGAAARRRPLRPRQGARRHRAATSSSARSASAARTSRSSPTTWAWATWRTSCRTSAAGGAPTPSSTSPPRRGATPRPTGGSPRSATTPPTTSGSCSRRAGSCVPRRPGDVAARRPRGAAATARRRAICGTLAGDPADTALDRRAEPQAAPRGARRRALHGAPRCGRSPTRRRCGITRADDGGWTFRVSRTLRLRAPGARLPVRSGSPAGPQRDRVVAHGQHDPRHRRARRGGAGAAARPARRESTVTDAIRTPDVLLDGLPGFEWAPSFRTWDGLRLAHVDVGDGAPVVMLHGEPTWSYLWRKVAPPVLEAGHRVILPDLPGLRALGQADGRGLVLLRPPHGGDQGPRGVARPARRDVRPARLGRADRAAGSRSSSPSGSRGSC